jgi:hypothetical protein
VSSKKLKIPSLYLEETISGPIFIQIMRLDEIKGQPTVTAMIFPLLISHPCDVARWL